MDGCHYYADLRLDAIMVAISPSIVHLVSMLSLHRTARADVPAVIATTAYAGLAIVWTVPDRETSTSDILTVVTIDHRSCYRPRTQLNIRHRHLRCHEWPRTASTTLPNPATQHESTVDPKNSQGDLWFHLSIVRQVTRPQYTFR